MSERPSEARPSECSRIDETQAAMKRRRSGSEDECSEVSSGCSLVAHSCVTAVFCMTRPRTQSSACSRMGSESDERKRAETVGSFTSECSISTSTLSIEPCAMSIMHDSSCARSRFASAPMSPQSRRSSPLATR